MNKITTKVEPAVRKAIQKMERRVLVTDGQPATQIQGKFHDYLRPDALITTREVSPEAVKFVSPYRNVDVKPTAPEAPTIDFMF